MKLSTNFPLGSCATLGAGTSDTGSFRSSALKVYATAFRTMFLGSDADGHFLIRSLLESLQFLNISIVPRLTTTSPIVAFPPRHPFTGCSSRRTCLFEAAHYSRPIIL